MASPPATTGCRSELARADCSYPRLLQRLARTQLLILDDWGLAALDHPGRHDLREVLDDRYARCGTLVTSQLPVDHWHELVGDPIFGNCFSEVDKASLLTEKFRHECSADPGSAVQERYDAIDVSWPGGLPSANDLLGHQYQPR